MSWAWFDCCFFFIPLLPTLFLQPKSLFYVLPCAFAKLNDIKPISNNGTIYFPTAWNIISLFKQCDPLNYSSIEVRSTQNSFVSYFVLKENHSSNPLLFLISTFVLSPMNTSYWIFRLSSITLFCTQSFLNIQNS